MDAQQVREIEILKEAINVHYRKAELQEFGERVLYPLLQRNEQLSQQMGAFDIFVEKSRRTKEKYVMLFVAVLVTEDACRALLEVFGTDIRALIERLIFDEYDISILELSENFERKDVVTHSLRDRFDMTGLRPLQPAYFLFATTTPQYAWSGGLRDYDFNLFLPLELRAFLRRYFPEKPEYTSLLPLKEQPKAAFHYSNEAAIVRGATTLATMIDDDLIEYDTAGKKILKGTLKNVQSSCEFREFFAITARGKEAEAVKHLRDVEYLATELLINLATQDEKDLEINKGEPESVGFVRLWMRGLCGKPDIHFSPLKHIITHVKEQYSGYYTFKEQFLGAEFYGLLASLPTGGEWIAADNFVKKALYSETGFMPLTRDHARQIFYVTPSRHGDSRFGRVDKKSINSTSEYRRYIAEPLVKGVVFLFAAMGLMEIVYDEPKSGTPLNDKPYLSPFDGLRGVRLTGLGAYLLGRTKSYEPSFASQTSTQTTGKLILDDERLMATLTGAHPKLETILLDFMRPMMVALGKKDVEGSENEAGSRFYVMDAQSFLQKCTTEHDVVEKITTFKKRVSDDVPAIWQEFFDDVESKLELFEEAFEYRVFTIKPNRELMRLLTTDQFLKDHVLKAEGHRILIKEDDIPQVKKRLVKLGFVTALEKRRTATRSSKYQSRRDW